MCNICVGDFVYCNIDSNNPLLGTVISIDRQTKRVKVRLQYSYETVWCHEYEIDKIIQEVG